MVDRSLIEGVLGGPGDPLQDSTFIEHRLSDRFVLEYAHVFTRFERRFRGAQDVPNQYDAFLILNERRVGIRFHLNDEDRAADRDYCRGRTNVIVVRHASEVFDLNADFAEEDFEEVDPAIPIGAEDHAGVGVNLEFASVGNLENAPSVGTGNYYFLRLNGIARVERPRVASAADDGYLADEVQQFGRSVRRRIRRLLRPKSRARRKQYSSVDRDLQQWPDMCHDAPTE